MIRAMTIKELREMAGIAVLSIVAFLLLVGRAVEAFRSDRGNFESVPFVDGEFLSWHAILALTLAVALACRQSGWEGLRGTYLFLLHRPASHTALIAAKLAVGLVLLLLLTAWPILVYGLWAAMPGTHASPFEWSMTRPTWCCWLSASLVYLGSFLTALRPARWLGTKLLPLVMAFACFKALDQTDNFLAVLVSVVIVDALLVRAICQVTARRDFG